MSPHDTLVKAFRALTSTERANLLWHARRKTPICCGENAYAYFQPESGAG